MIGHVLDLLQGADRVLQITGVPQDDRGDEQVEARAAMLLVFVGAISDFTEPVNEDRACHAVAGLALVEFPAGRAPQFRIADPVECEPRAFQPPQLSKSCGNAVLPLVSGKLTHDQRCGHGAGADGCDNAQDLRPMGADQLDVDSPRDHRLQRRVGGGPVETIEPAVLQPGNARCKLESEERAESEDILGNAAAVESVTRDEILITYDPAIVKSASWALHLPPLGFNLSGCSGGPVLVHGIRNNIHRWFAVGLIADGPKGQGKKGEAAEFDMIRLRRIDIVQPDGTIKQPAEDTGWLPGYATTGR
jgi:hypothetical protein